MLVGPAGLQQSVHPSPSAETTSCLQGLRCLKDQMQKIAKGIRRVQVSIVDLQNE